MFHWRNQLVLDLSPSMRSRLFASIGDTDKAIEWCEKAYE